MGFCKECRIEIKGRKVYCDECIREKRLEQAREWRRRKNGSGYKVDVGSTEKMKKIKRKCGICMEQFHFDDMTLKGTDQTPFCKKCESKAVRYRDYF